MSVPSQRPVFQSALLLFALAIVSAEPAAAREFKLGLVTPPNHAWTKAAEAFGKSLREASGGRHSVVVYPSQQLGNEAQMLQQLQTGAIDMAFLTVAEVSNRVPEFGAFYAPYLARDIAGAAEILRSDVAMQMLEPLPRKVGVFGIAYGIAGMRQILTRARTAGPADLRGRKLRITPFAPIRDFYQLLGAAPTPMPLASVYDALANGQVDAIDMDLETTIKLRYHELTDTVVLSNHMMFPMIGLVSARVWVRLDEADRNQVRDLMRAELDAMVDRYVIDERRYEQQLRETDVVILEAGPEFFGSAISEWDAVWSKRSSALEALRSRDRGATGD